MAPAETSGPKEITSTNSGICLDDPLVLHTNDLSSASIVSFKLLGTSNYKAWSSATELALRARNKLGFVDGTCVRPVDDDTKGRMWDRADAVVLSWLLGSVSENLYASHVLSKSSSEVWDDLKETYEKTDGSVVFSIYQRINSCVQGNDSLSDYYNKLNALWKEFDSMTNLTTCTCAAANSLTTHKSQINLMQFLMGLDDSFSQVRSNILMREPLPSVKAAFAICSREESYKLGSANVSTSAKNLPSSAFMGKVNEPKKNFSNTSTSNNNGTNRNNLICKNCGKKGHTIERCYRLIGFPPKEPKSSNNNFGQNKNVANCSSQNNKGTQGNEDAINQSSNVQNSNGNNTSSVFSSEQIAQILSLINGNQGLNAVANMAGFTEKPDLGDW